MMNDKTWIYFFYALREPAAMGCPAFSKTEFTLLLPSCLDECAVE